VIPTLSSRSSFDWKPAYPAPIQPVRGRTVSSRSRLSSNWTPNIGAVQSTAEMYAQQLGIPVPYWAKKQIDWRRAIPLGMGRLGSSTQQISAIAASGASATVGILVALGTIGGPIGAAAGALIVVGQLIASVFSGCGQTCVQASDIANQVGDALTQNLSAYLSAPVHTTSLQAAALNNFNTAWTALAQGCGSPSLQSAGENCISERQQGACTYKTSPGGWQQQNGTWTYVYPGANGSGSTCWNYFVGFHDPIANDPTVVPDSVVTAAGAATAPVTAGATTAPAVSSADLTPLLLVGGLLALGVLL
jgi:hypothetical protein